MSAVHYEFPCLPFWATRLSVNFPVDLILKYTVRDSGPRSYFVFLIAGRWSGFGDYGIEFFDSLLVIGDDGGGSRGRHRIRVDFFSL